MNSLYRITLLAAATLFAQLPPIQAQGRLDAFDKHRTADNDAIAKAIAGDIDAAVDILASRGSAVRGSLFSYQQAAIALIQRAYVCQAELDYAGTASATEAAISILTRAIDDKAKGARTPAVAQVYVLLGQVYQELAGSNRSARVCYQAAIAADPSNRMSRIALERQDEEDAKFRRFGKGGN